jgi:uncharacterized protein YigA (DUF484 family)
MKSKQNSQEPDPTDSQVADYLAANPGFFTDRDNLLAKMTLPHQQGGAVSLEERQVSVLRDRNKSTKNQLDTLLNAARRNNEIFDKCQRLVLSLIESKDSAAFFNSLESSFKRDFNCHAYSLIIFGDNPEQINHFTSRVSLSSAKEYVNDLLKNRNPTLGVLRSTEQDFLFRHASAKVKSAAVLPIKTRTIKSDSTFENTQIAMLAIGSDQENDFHSSMDTLFIEFVADVIARLLPQHVSLSISPSVDKLVE